MSTKRHYLVSIAILIVFALTAFLSFDSPFLPLLIVIGGGALYIFILYIYRRELINFKKQSLGIDPWNNNAGIFRKFTLVSLSFWFLVVGFIYYLYFLSRSQLEDMGLGKLWENIEPLQILFRRQFGSVVYLILLALLFLLPFLSLYFATRSQNKRLHSISFLIMIISCVATLVQLFLLFFGTAH